MNEKDEQAELAALLRRAQDLADRCRPRPESRRRRRF